MVETITVAALAIIAFGAGIWGWWFSSREQDDTDTTTSANDSEI